MGRQPRAAHDLKDSPDVAALSPDTFDTILGIGQYPITPMDHANGMATMAAGGLRATAHFVTKVTDPTNGDRIVFNERLPDPNTTRLLNDQQVADLDYALSTVASSHLQNGWDAGGKTGTWEYNHRADANDHVWMVGFTKKMAAAVWVGNSDVEGPIIDQYGKKLWGSGPPAGIWKGFMLSTISSMKLSKDGTSFSAPVYTGITFNPNWENNVPSPTPTTPPVDPGCQDPMTCPTDTPTGTPTGTPSGSGTGGPGGGGGGGGGGGHGIATQPPPG